MEISKYTNQFEEILPNNGLIHIETVFKTKLYLYINVQTVSQNLLSNWILI